MTPSQRLQTQNAIHSIPMSVPPSASAARSALSDPCIYNMQVMVATNTISTPKTKGRQILSTARNTPLLANLCLLMGFREEWGPDFYCAEVPINGKHFSASTTNGVIQARPALALKGTSFDAFKTGTRTKKLQRNRTA